MDILKEIERLDEEYQNNLIALFGLQKGQIIKGYEIWNILIEKGLWDNILGFASQDRNVLFLENALIDADPLIDKLFDANIIKGKDYEIAVRNVDYNFEAEYEGFVMAEYQIAGAKIECVNSGSDQESWIEVLINYRTEEGWSPHQEVMFSYKVK